MAITVRRSARGDTKYAEAVCALIDASSEAHDISKRKLPDIESVIKDGISAIALDQDAAIGFGYVKKWGDGFVSHSALVVDEAYRGKGIGKDLKKVLMEISKEKFPASVIMSVTNSEAVIKVNSNFGFIPCPLTSLTKDENFWEGCRGCRSFEKVNKDGSGELNPLGKRCCCRGFVCKD